MRKDVVIVHYNTPELTLAAIHSLNKCTPDCRITLFDNSDSKPFTERFDNVEIIDNTRGQIIDFDKWIESFTEREPSPDNNYGSAKHCLCVDYMFDKLPGGFVLMDSDVLVKRDISMLWDKSVPFVGEIKTHKSRFGNVERVTPVICYINVRMLENYGVRYYNPDYMFALTRKRPNVAYDTGCWFLEDCCRNGLVGSEIKTCDYVEHLGHGSWKTKDVSGWLEQHKELFT